MALVDSCTLHHHVVLYCGHEVTSALFLCKALLEQTFVDALNHASILVMQLSNQLMGQLVVQLLSFDELFEDVFEVCIDKNLYVVRFHLVNMLDNREEPVIWRSQENLAQVALIVDESEIAAAVS